MRSCLPTVKILIESLSIREKYALLRYMKKAIVKDILNSNSLSDLVRTFLPQIKCPHCLSEIIIKYGAYKDRQRYKCKPCNKTFNDLTNTPFHYLHNHEQVKAYLKEMISKKTIREIAKKLDIRLDKAFFWRHKFCHAFGFSNSTVLEHIIESDETFFQLSYKGCKVLEAIAQRPARKRGGASKRGISNEKIAVISAIDSFNRIILTLGGRGRLTNKMLEKAFSKRIPIQGTPPAVFVSDGLKPYAFFADKQNLIHKIIVSTHKKFKTNDGFNLQKVNQLHCHLKQWMASFGGVATKYLQNYLNYFQTAKRLIHVKEQSKAFLTDLLSSYQSFTRYKDIKNRYLY